MYEICSKLTIKTLEGRYWRRSGELWTHSTHYSGFSVVDFEQVNAGWAFIVFSQVTKYQLNNPEHFVG